MRVLSLGGSGGMSRNWVLHDMCKTVMLRAYTILCIVVVSTGIRAFSIYITVNQSSLMITHCITLLWYKKWPIQCAKHNVPHEETVQLMTVATAEKKGEGILSVNPTNVDTLALCSWPAVVNCLQFWAAISCCQKHHFHQIVCDIFRWYVPRLSPGSPAQCNPCVWLW